MGDISEMRGVIVLFTIVAATISLILLIPSDFYAAAIDPSVAPDATISDVIAWNNTYIANLTYNPLVDTSNTFTLNGYNYGINVYPIGSINIHTYASWWIFEWDRDDFQWFMNGVHSSVLYDYIGNIFEVIPTSIIDSFDSPQTFEIKNSKTQATITLVYDTTTYDTFDAALKANDASIIFNVDWSDRNTSMNALQLVGMVLTASLPNIHPVLNGLFAVFGWGLVAASTYLAFIFVLRIVGAIFGGGGA